MAFKNNLPETPSVSGKAIILHVVQCTQDFLLEDLSLTFFYFLLVAADRQCTKGVTVFKMSDFASS